MFTEQMLDKMKELEFNPVYYFNHLSKEDKQFVLNHINELVPNKYAELLLPVVPVLGRDKVDGGVPYTLDLLYRTLRVNDYGNIRKIYAFDSGCYKPGATIGSDYIILPSIIRFSDKFTIKKMVYSICGMEYEGIKSIPLIVDAIGAILSVNQLYDFTTFFRLFQEEIKPIKAMTVLKNHVIGADGFALFDTLNESIMTILRAINDDIYQDPNILFAALQGVCSFFGFFLDLTDEKEVEYVWNSYLMKCLKQPVSDINRLRFEFNQIIKAVVNPNEYTWINGKEKISYRFPAPGEIETVSEPDMSISEEIAVDNFKKIDKELIIEMINQKTNLEYSEDDITFDIDEEMLTMYMMEYNHDYPIQPLFSGEDRYAFWDEGILYTLFQIRRVKSFLYAIGIKEDNGDEKDVSIIQFSRNAKLRYIYKPDDLSKE